MAAGRILLVEDDPDIQLIAQMALETVGGFEVTAFSSGPEALANVQRIKPDIILLDFMMPMMGGDEVIKALKAEPATAAIPVVFMTARIRAEEVQRYRDLGAVDVIPKPFDPMALPQQISAILAAHS